MAIKRTAQEAFGKPNGQLSAFAAAKLRSKQSSTTTTDQDVKTTLVPGQDDAPILDSHDALQPDLSIVDTVKSSRSIIALPLLKYSSVTAEDDSSISTKSGAIDYVLKPHDNLLAVGEYDIEILEGAITIHGAVLRKGSGRHRVHALSTHALPRIEPRASNNRIRLHSVKSQVAALEPLSPLFRSIGAQPASGLSFKVLFSARSDDVSRTLFSLDEGVEIKRAVSQLCQEVETVSRRRSIICIGSKSSGKSTLARTLCNALLTRSPVKSCLYLDIDPGQPEFGPPGQVYLVEVTKPVFGPSYTHFASPQSTRYRLLCAHTLAATSFREDPQHYLACIKHLLNHESVLQGKVPLVINSCGWINGLGARMLHDVFLHTGITDALLIDVTDQDLVRTVRSKAGTCFALPRPPLRPPVRSPADLRQMHTMAYFHARSKQLNDDDAATLVRKPIARWRPWIVRYDQPDHGVAAVVSYGQTFNQRFLLEVLNGTLIAIVTSRSSATASSTHALDALVASRHATDKNWSTYVTRTAEGIPHVQGCPALDPGDHEYHGLAIIRCVDVQSKTMELLTPLPTSDIAAIMHETVLLVRGNFDGPDWAYLEDLHASGTQSQPVEGVPWVSRQDMVGIEGAVWRLRHPPTTSQLSGSSRR